MSLVNLLRNEKPAQRADKVLAAYRQMDQENRDAFRQLIADPEWSGPQIAEAMVAMGFDEIDGDRINHFRRKLRAGKVTL